MYGSYRFIVHFLAILMAVLAGCTGEEYESVPVSIQKQPPYSYQGQIGRLWGGDNFEITEGGKLHYAFMRGIDTPEFGQQYHEESKEMLRQLARNKPTTIHVIDRDEWKREICDVTIEHTEGEDPVDPALRLLENGLAWFDNSEGPYADSYADAETVAREKKVGIWSQPDPVPPWDFWEANLRRMQESAYRKNR